MKRDPRKPQEQLKLPGLPQARYPVSRPGPAREDLGWSGLPLSPEGQEAAKTKQEKLF